jgi:adenosine deaminase
MIEEIKKLPKVELHLHLDGSLDPKIALPLIKSKSLEEVRDILDIDNDTDNLNEYLEKFNLPLEILQTKLALKQSAINLVDMLKRDNVIYAEVRFAPQFHTRLGLSYDEIIESVLEGLKNPDIKINVILCCMRGNDTWEENLKTVDYAYKYLNKGVCGIDLAGAEAIYPTRDYEYVFTKCRILGISFTIHAGEGSGSVSIKEALDMGAKRIGHGINYENDNILNRYINENITLEVCPSSNIHTEAVSSIDCHPIYELYKKGVKVTINTDNRTVSKTNLNDEYELLAHTFDFKIDDFKQMNINAIKASFLNDDDKAKLLDYYR